MRIVREVGIRIACVAALAAVCPVFGQVNQQQVLELHNEVVCRVNTEVISKRDIESRMGRAYYELYAMRARMQELGKWTELAQKEWDAEYFRYFRDHLRDAIKEQLMLQEAQRLAKDEKLDVDKAKLIKRRDQWAEKLAKDGVLGQPGYTLNDIEKQVREQMLIDNFRGTLMNMLDLPSRPQVEAHYRKNIEQYQRKPGVKVCRLQIARIVETSLGTKSVRENASKLAEDLYIRLTKDGEDFRDMVMDFSDDEAAIKKRGGLILGPDGDEFIDPEANPSIARMLRGMDTKFPKNISPVFDLDGRYWAIIQLVERRPAGPQPLDDKLYQKIYDSLAEQRNKSSEDEWFRKTIQKSLILRIEQGKETNIPLAFFFPEDEQAAPAKEAPKPEKAAPDAAKTDDRKR